MKILFARYGSPADFLTHYDPTFSWGGLVLPTRAAPSFEEPIVVEVSYPRLPNRVLLRARAIDRDDRGDEPRLLVKFLPSELHKRDYLLAVARGDVTPKWERRHRRFPIRVPVRFGLPDAPTRSDAMTEDVSSCGLFLRTPMLLPLDTDVAVEVQPGGAEAVTLRGQVAWVRNRAPSSGFGVRLDAHSRREARSLRRLIRSLKASGQIDEGRREEGPPVTIQ